MAIRTNLKSLTPRRQAYKQEITLLSHGYSNPQAWPDGKLTVFPWDNSIDQWLIDNVRLLNRTELVYGLLQRCCDLNGGKVDEFVVDEIVTVLLVSRALANDGILIYKSTCPFCGTKRDEQIQVPNELEKVGEKSTDYPGYDEITLPVTRDVVKIYPLLVRDEKEILNRTTEQKHNIPDGEMRTVMRVISINESKPDNLEELITWYRALSPKDAQFLESEGKRITPHLNTNIEHVCEEPTCGQKFMHFLAFDQEFFR
jgi:hypothetical protein